MTQIKFKALEDYISETEATHKMTAQYQDKKAQAEEKVHELKHKYEKTIQDSVKQGGKDVTAALDKIADEIEQAERVASRRQSEYEAFVSLDHEKTSPMDVVNAFKDDVKPEFMAKKGTAALERMEAAKRAYAKAVLEFYDTQTELEDIAENAIDGVGPAYRYKFDSTILPFQPDIDRYFMPETDIYDLFKLKRMPRTIQEVK